MKKISAQIIADSVNKQGDRITSMVLTFPRFILAELNTSEEEFINYKQDNTNE